MKKSLLLTVAIGLISSTAHAKIIEFSDLEIGDNFTPVMDFASRGIFSGIDGKAALDQNILKNHATFFLLKVLGDQTPTLEEAVDKGIISSIPKDSTASLSKAEWIVMLSRAFKVPVGSTEGKQWYEPSWEVGKKIMVISDTDNPLDTVNRGFAVRTAYSYEKIFQKKTQEELLALIEKNLMEIRDKFGEPMDEGKYLELESQIWKTIKITEAVTDSSSRLSALRDYEMFFLVALEIKENPNPIYDAERKQMADFFIKSGLNHLPQSTDFAKDLRLILGE